MFCIKHFGTLNGYLFIHTYSGNLPSNFSFYRHSNFSFIVRICRETINND